MGALFVETDHTSSMPRAELHESLLAGNEE